MSLTLYVIHTLVFNFVVRWHGWVRPTGLDTALDVRGDLLGVRHRRRVVVAPALRDRPGGVGVPQDRRLSAAEDRRTT